MTATRYYRTTLLITLMMATLAGSAAYAASEAETRKQLFENQRNLIMLRKEKRTYTQALQKAEARRALSTETDTIDAEILDLKDSIDIANLLIENASELVARQRLLLATLEKGVPPSALDIALNKVLKSNLPELLKNLSNNEAAHKDIARLKILLKQQTGFATELSHNSQSVSLVQKQKIAENELLRLLALFSRGSADDDQAEDKKITINGSTEDGLYSEENTLIYLGHQQYHMELTVYSGNINFTVDNRHWEFTIPETENQAVYIVIYDLAKEEPRLVIFNKSLLLK